MDKRLLLCAELIEGSCVCDVGTDHAYLPCYAVSSGICDRALACDVAEGPLSSAKEHIKLSGLGDRIKAVLSDGLDSVPSEGVTDVVLAGMGGELIADILGRCSWIKAGSVNIVIQPMTKAEYLRKWLFDNGFSVTKEKACISGRFAYTVMSGRFMSDAGDKSDALTDEQLWFGLVECDDEESAEYIKRRCDSLERAAKGMLGSADKKALGERIMAAVNNKRREVGRYAKGE